MKRTSFFVLGGLIVAAGISAVAFDLSSRRANTWFNSHQLTTSVGADLILVGATYLIIDHFIASGLRRRWRRAAGPALYAVNGALCEAHRCFNRMMLGESYGPDFGSRALDSYTQAVANQSALLTATPELAVIYALVGRHALCARTLVHIVEKDLIPSQDPVPDVNSLAESITAAIAQFLGQPMLVATPLSLRIPTIADVLDNAPVSEK